MYKILIPEDIDPAGKDYLWERGYELRAGVPVDDDTLRRELTDKTAGIAGLGRIGRQIRSRGSLPGRN
jgi:phosphoglycerate dehydrogenase-like enzyme